MVLKILAALCLFTITAFSADYVNKVTGLALPQAFGGFDRDGVTDFSEQDPRLGNAVEYNDDRVAGSGCSLTVYIFNMGMSSIKDGIKDPAVQSV